jgi:cell wall-associated NlpC family hydrolase
MVLRNSPGRHRASKRLLTVALSLTLASLAPTVFDAPANASPQGQIASKAAEAKRLAAAITANDNRISVLDEQYDQTNLKIQQTSDALTKARADIESARRKTNRIHDLLRGRAAQLYTQAGSQSPIPALDASNVQELGAASRYSDAAAQRDDNLLNDLAAARELLHSRQTQLNQALAAQNAAAKALASQKQQIVATQAQQRQLLSQVKGQLKNLYAQAAREQRLAAQAAARAAWARKVEQQRAARQAAAGSIGSSISDPNTGTAPANVPPPSGGAATAIATARSKLGDPYVYAAAGPNSFDCPGLTMYAWASAGVSLPHSSSAQYASLPHVPMDSLQPGDLVFYGHPIHHVGLYVGGGSMIEAPHTGAVVRYASIYRGDFAGAARP